MIAEHVNSEMEEKKNLRIAEKATLDTACNVVCVGLEESSGPTKARAAVICIFVGANT